MRKTLYRIDTGYACAGIVLQDGIVIIAAPIYRWMIGKHITEVAKWRKIKCITSVQGSTDPEASTTGDQEG